METRKQTAGTDMLLLAGFAALCLVPLLSLFRSLDDNTLTSWAWTVTPDRLPVVFGMLLCGLFCSLLISRMPIHDQYYPVLLFFTAFLCALPLWQEPEVILDAARYFLQAKSLSSSGPAFFLQEWGREVPAWTDLPLAPFLYGVIFKLSGESRTAIQLGTTLMFSLSAVCTFSIGKYLWDRETGFLAGLLLLASPYLLAQVPLMLVDVPVMFFLSLAACTFLPAADRGGAVRMVIASAAVGLALFSKYSAWPMLLMLPVLTLNSFLRGNRRAIPRSCLIIGAACLPMVLFILMKEDLVRSQMELLRSYQWPGLDRWKEGLASTFLFQIHPFVTIAALAGAGHAVMRKDLRFLFPAWFLFFALLFRADRIRYLLPLFPLLALMAGYGLKALLRQGTVRRFAAWCAVASAVAVAWGAYLPFLNSTSMANLRDSAQYLESLPVAQVAVSILPQQASLGNTEMAIPLLDLYTSKLIRYARGRLTRPETAVLQTAPLRFTWDVALPAFYEDTDRGSVGRPAVLISSDPRTGARLSGKTIRFALDTGTFRYRTLVTLHEEPLLAGSAHSIPDGWPVRDSEQE